MYHSLVILMLLGFVGVCPNRVWATGFADGEPKEAQSDFRILLISDIHYGTDPSLKAGGDRLGYTQQERMEIMMRSILQEHAEKPISAILLLGDLSIDDYGYRNLSDNFCKKLKEEYLDKLPFPVYTITGNHDSYPADIWGKEMGSPRQYSVVINGVAFILADTFNGIASSASGAPYTPVDMPWLSAEVEKHKGKPIFLAAHHFDWSVESAAFKNLLREQDNILALFSGHTHMAQVVQLSSYGNKHHFNIGCFSYYTKPTNGVWDFDHFDPAYAWGYQLLDFADGKATTYHKMIPAKYTGSNGVYHFKGEKSDTYTFSLKQ